MARARRPNATAAEAAENARLEAKRAEVLSENGAQHDTPHANASHPPTENPIADTPPQSTRPDAVMSDLKAQLAATFEKTAEVLEHTARLAEDDAHRKALQGQPDQEAAEHRHAERARAAARTARTNARRLSSPPPR